MQAFFKRLTADPPAQPPKLAESIINPPPCEPEPAVPKVDAIALLMAGVRGTRSNPSPAPAFVTAVPAQPPPPESYGFEPKCEQQHDENTPPAASELPDVCKAPLNRWILEEFPVWCRYVLAQRGNAPDENETRSIARSGMLHAFDVARETLLGPSLQERYGWLATVALECPRGLQSIICMDESASRLCGGKITFDAEAMRFGELWKDQGHDRRQALDEMQRKYAEILDSMQQPQGAAVARQAAFQHALQANASDGFND